jgi:spore maturation protein CgeB
VRILIVDPYYAQFLDAHYAERPGMAERPYSEQLDSLLSSGFGTSDAYSRNFRELGHQATEIITNCQPLQLRWAKENGLRLPRMLTAVRSALFPLGPAASRALVQRVSPKQIEAFAPDVVYRHDVASMTADELNATRAQGALLVGQITSLPPDIERLQEYDLLTSALTHFVDRFRAEGIAAEFLRLGFDEAVLDRLRSEGLDPSPEAERKYPVSFVGGLNPKVHVRRVPRLEAVCRAVDVDVWGYGADELESDSPLRERYRGEAWGLGMYRVLAQSGIVINFHEDVHEGEAANMRLFEATGSGALLITEGYENLPEIFEPGREVVTYEDTDDLVGKIRYYLEHEDERIRIAKAGQARTLSEHTFAQRMRELAGMLESYLNR